jgi:hypothetical protein
MVYSHLLLRQMRDQYLLRTPCLCEKSLNFPTHRNRASVYVCAKVCPVKAPLTDGRTVEGYFLAYFLCLLKRYFRCVEDCFLEHFSVLLQPKHAQKLRCGGVGGAVLRETYPNLSLFYYFNLVNFF